MISFIILFLLNKNEDIKDNKYFKNNKYIILYIIFY